MPPNSNQVARRVIESHYRQSAFGENLRRALLNPISRSFIVKGGDIVKMIGYKIFPGEHVASIGTSVLNRLCITDGIGPCIAVVIGSEKFHDCTRLAGSNVRLFHIFPSNQKGAEDVESHIRKMQDNGFTVKVAMHGGVVGNPRSEKLAQDLRGLFTQMKVNVAFDESCEKRGEKFTPLGGAVRYFYPGHPDNYAVQFVTDIIQDLPDQLGPS